tara:strand:+ start:996 stop:1772 length:777 start_codon:yes stop_codon:yes gene_type:complete
MDSVLYKRHHEMAYVTINRPKRRNALTQEAWQKLAYIFTEISNDESLRCVVITGAGTQSFAAGNDISEFEKLRKNAEDVRAYNDITLKAIHAIENSIHPTIARIDGYCLGGGLEIALACDIRIASPPSTFGIPVKNMGIYLDPALVETMVNSIGRTTALELVLEGRMLTAQEALERRILTRIAPVDSLDAEVNKSVEQICSGAPLANRFNRNAIRQAAIKAPSTDADFSKAASYGDTEDYHNAWTSFLNKKKPTFKGN